MAIKASDWYDSFDIEWADDAYQWNTDYRWRLKIMEGGVLLFEGTPPTVPPSSWIAPPHAWARVKTPAVDPLAIKAHGWCDNSYVWFAHDERFSDDEYRMKIMDGGMLLLQEKTKDGGFLRVAPHAWARVETPAVDPLAIKASDWCDNFYIPLVDDHAPGFSGSYAHESAYRMKIMDGGVLAGS